MLKGKLFLIPCPLGIWDNSLQTLPPQVISLIPKLNQFIVEDIRTARRFIKKVNPEADIDSITFHVLNKHTNSNQIIDYLKCTENGKNIGIISEAGCPAIADPGASIVEMAHQFNITVVPIVGPSSIILALMSSGFNGQHFTFNGYLPIDKLERIKSIKTLESSANKNNHSQLFIETPFRNTQLLADILKTCKDDTRLCIACELTTPNEFVKTQSIYRWKQKHPELNKKNVVFILG